MGRWWVWELLWVCFLWWIFCVFCWVCGSVDIVFGFCVRWIYCCSVVECFWCCIVWDWVSLWWDLWRRAFSGERRVLRDACLMIVFDDEEDLGVVLLKNNLWFVCVCLFRVCLWWIWWKFLSCSGFGVSSRVWRISSGFSGRVRVLGMILLISFFVIIFFCCDWCGIWWILCFLVWDVWRRFRNRLLCVDKTDITARIVLLEWFCCVFFCFLMWWCCFEISFELSCV